MKKQRIIELAVKVKLEGIGTASGALSSASATTTSSVVTDR